MVEQNAAANFELAGSDAETPQFCIFVVPKKWIAEASEFGIVRRLNDGFFPFVPSAQLRIGRHGKALCFAKIAVTVAKRGAFERRFLNSGVENGRDAVVVDSAAGEAAVGVGPAGRGGKSDRQVAPVNHVFADGMVPVHVAPDGGVGVVLEKHVVEAVPENGAVGIVHPIFRREEMELRAKRIGGELSLKSVVSDEARGAASERRECGK